MAAVEHAPKPLVRQKQAENGPTRANFCFYDVDMVRSGLFNLFLFRDQRLILIGFYINRRDLESLKHTEKEKKKQQITPKKLGKIR